MADRGRVGSLRVGCKSAAQKEWRKSHEGHRDRVRSVQPATDMTAPTTMGMVHFRTNLKKERLLEDRYMEIDRENQVLLKKMSEAMKKPNPYKKLEDSQQAPPSLNRMGRKLELTRITQENQRMLKAIAAVKPVYDTKRWEDNYRRSEVHLKNCCAYPVITRLPRVSSSPSVLMSIEPEAADGSPSGATAVPGRGSDDDRNFVLKEGMRIDNRYFLLEMSTDGRSLSISAYDGDSQTSLELVVKEKKHRQLYRELNGDYSLIAKRLRVDGDRLMID